MTAARIPGFTAEESLGIFAQEYHLAQSRSDSIGIILTLAFGPYMKPKGGCCKGNCDRPCKAWPCSNEAGKPDCCCEST
jgi:hypothetical protein